MATGKIISDAALRATLNLPKTTFPMRANAAKRELQHVERLTTQLYRRQLEDRKGQTKDFVLHDGPPYANGSLHMGHFLNKVLKDIVNRNNLLSGKRILFKPGWDCHGLPIEMKALSELMQTGNKGKQALSPLEIRKIARNTAESAIKLQRDDFRRWGVLADWEVEARETNRNAYVTLDKTYAAQQLRVFKNMVEAGFVHRSVKPVYWSPSSVTALAEAELEYVDNHKSTSVYVAFPITTAAITDKIAHNDILKRFPGCKAVVWTTTPWTLPANVALAVNPELSYSIITLGINSEEHVLLLCKARIDAFVDALKATGVNITAGAVQQWEGTGADLVGLAFTHPLSSHLPQIEGLTAPTTTSNTATTDVLKADTASSKRLSLVLGGAHVLDDSGTGIVHTAPGHGHDDFDVVTAHNSANTSQQLPILCPVNAVGQFMPDMGAELAGKSIFTDGAETILAMLKSSGRLLGTQPYTHRYPYDWRTKKPVIIRATKQWFVRLDSLVEDSRKAIADVHMVPAVGRNRLSAMLGTRTEWCISRQRAWGVPIPVFYDKDTDEAVMNPTTIDAVSGTIEKHGTDAWWTLSPTEILGDAAAAAGINPANYVKGQDTLDVWFDSGTSWSSAWYPDPAPERSDLVIEGSDQHRGWFQSSLLTSVATRKSAPYKAIVTHGFVLDEQMRKMSKSLGNVISPNDIIVGDAKGKGKQKGASQPHVGGHGGDVLRYWVASSDFTKDIVIGPTIINSISENVRKIRNTARFLLGNLDGYATTGVSHAKAGADAILKAWSTPVNAQLVDLKAVPVLDRCLLHRLSRFQTDSMAGFDSYAFMRVVNALNTFTSTDLSAFYFDICKDRLYAGLTGAGNDAKRDMTQHILWESLRVLNQTMAPILMFNAESIYQHSGDFIGVAPALGGSAKDETDEVRVDSSIFDVPRLVLPTSWNEEWLQLECESLMMLRGEANKLIEQARSQKFVGSSSEVKIVVHTNAKGHLQAILEEAARRKELEDLFLVSQVELHDGPASAHVQTSQFTFECAVPVPASIDNESTVWLRCVPADGHKCARCWKYAVDVNSHPSQVCSRCDAAISKLQAWGT